MHADEFQALIADLRRRAPDPRLADVFEEYALEANGRLRLALTAFQRDVDAAAAAGVDEASLKPLRRVIAQVARRLPNEVHRIGGTKVESVLS